MGKSPFSHQKRGNDLRAERTRPTMTVSDYGRVVNE